MNTTVRTDRLRKLADHLMNKLPSGHKFSFGTLYEEKPLCGTKACALGELPFCFPEDWIIDVRGESPSPLPYLKQLSDENTFEDAGAFFNLDGHQINHLFMPRSQDAKTIHPGLGQNLSPWSTPQQVGLNILYFCALEEGAE